MTDDQKQRTKELLITLGCVPRSARDCHDAWRELFSLWYQPFIKRAMLRGLCEDAAVDVAADAIAKAVKYAHKFNAGGNTAAWMFTICNRQCYNHLKTIKQENDRFIASEHEPVSGGTAVLHQLEQREQVAAIGRAFNRLSSDDRAICMAKLFGGAGTKKRADISPGLLEDLLSTLGLNNANALNQRWRRAKTQLTQFYDDEIRGQP